MATLEEFKILEKLWMNQINSNELRDLLIDNLKIHQKKNPFKEENIKNLPEFYAHFYYLQRLKGNQDYFTYLTQPLNNFLKRKQNLSSSQKEMMLNQIEFLGIKGIQQIIPLLKESPENRPFLAYLLKETYPLSHPAVFEELLDSLKSTDAKNTTWIHSIVKHIIAKKLNLKQAYYGSTEVEEQNWFSLSIVCIRTGSYELYQKLYSALKEYPRLLEAIGKRKETWVKNAESWGETIKRLKTLEEAVKQYYYKKKALPENIQVALLEHGIFKKHLKDYLNDGWGKELKLTFASTSDKTFSLGSYGADGEKDGETPHGWNHDIERKVNLTKP